MTNVPQEVRDIWTDLYVFFDKHWKMPNEDDAWRQYWRDAEVLFEKHHHDKLIMDGILELITNYISARMKAEYLIQEEIEAEAKRETVQQEQMRF